jgi:hypothetical protein
MKTKEQKRQEAEERNAAYQALTIEQKREKLAHVPGNATKQHKKLAKE